MAAIDKLYVNDYFDYDDLRRWAIIYYPKLLNYFYDIVLTPEQFEKNKTYWAEQAYKRNQKDLIRLKNFKSYEEAIQNVIKHYKESANYDCPYNQAKEEVLDIIERSNKTKEDLEDIYTFPVMNTPLKVDKKLRWICPLPIIRIYLETQCGYKIRWYHKLFWKGKKLFL